MFFFKKQQLNSMYTMTKFYAHPVFVITKQRHRFNPLCGNTYGVYSTFWVRRPFLL